MAFSVPSITSPRSDTILHGSAPLQVTTLLSSPTLSDPLQIILSQTNDEIFRKGVPLDCIKAWRDRFYQGIDAETSLLKLSRDDAWAYDPKFFKTSEKQMEMGFDERGEMFLRQVTHKDYFVTAFHFMMHPRFWEDSDRHIKFLLSMYRLHKAVEFAPNDPTEQVFFKLMDCVVEKIVAHNPKLRNKEHFSIGLPDSQDHEVAQFKRLCCYKTVNGWRIGDFNAFPDTTIRLAQFNTNNTKMLILDKTGNIIDRPCTVFEARVRPEADGPLEKIVKVNIVLYRGSKQLSRDERNAVTFTFDVDLRDSPPTMHRFRQNAPWITDVTECVSPTDLALAKGEVEPMFEAFRTKFSVPFLQNPTSHIAFELYTPQSVSDKLWVLFHLLTELKKDPDANEEEIAHIAEEMDCSFSQEELEKLHSEGQAKLSIDGYTVSPGAVADKLLTTTKALLTDALRQPKPSKDISASSTPLVKPEKKGATKTHVSVEDEKEVLHEKKEKAPPVTSSVSVEEREAAEMRRLMEQRMLEKQVEKARRKEAYEREQRKLESQSSDTRGVHEESGSGISVFRLNPKDQRQVDSIYEGQPMKAKDFAIFSMSLMRKKLRSLGASVHPNVVGSHPKLHFKRSDGTSGGVTFRIHHGGDDHGYLSGQINTLDRILNF